MKERLSTHTFTEFAEQKLEEHLAELNTHYEGKVMPSNDEREQAYEKHFGTFTAELKEKIKELGEEEKDHAEVKRYQEKFREALA